MSNQQNDEYNQHQAEQREDMIYMYRDLQIELIDILAGFGLSFIGESKKKGKKVIELGKTKEQIINLFRKYKGAI